LKKKNSSIMSFWIFWRNQNSNWWWWWG